jgi:hypothetical protein
MEIPLYKEIVLNSQSDNEAGYKFTGNMDKGWN